MGFVAYACRFTVLNIHGFSSRSESLFRRMYLPHPQSSTGTCGTDLKQTGALSKLGRPQANRRVPSGVPPPPSPAQRCPSAARPRPEPWGLACLGDTVPRVALFYCFMLCGLCHEGFLLEILFAIHGERFGYITVLFTWAHNR